MVPVMDMAKGIIMTMPKTVKMFWRLPFMMIPVTMIRPAASRRTPEIMDRLKRSHLKYPHSPLPAFFNALLSFSFSGELL